MTAMIEAGKRRLLTTFVLLVAAGGFVAAALLCLMPEAVLEGIYNALGSDTWKGSPALRYGIHTTAVVYAWLAATFILILIDPWKYRTLYWINMAGLLALGVMSLLAGFSDGMPWLITLIDAILSVALAVALWLARPQTVIVQKT